MTSTPAYRILIVEDELLIAAMLSDLLATLGYQVAGVAADYNSAVQWLEGQSKPDLAILDINLESEKNGFDLALLLRDHYAVPFVFLTSYSDAKTMTEAIRLHPEAYLLKPFKSSDIYTTIEIVRNRRKWNEGTNQTVIIRDGNQSVKLRLSEIVWMKSDNVYVEVQLVNKKLLLRKSLDGLIAELSSDMIVRTHRSYAVNIEHLNAVSGAKLQLGEYIIPLSRLHKENLIEKFRSLSG